MQQNNNNDNPFLLYGYLYKLKQNPGVLGSAWTRRYFVVEERQLKNGPEYYFSYYPDESKVKDIKSAGDAVLLQDIMHISLLSSSPRLGLYLSANSTMDPKIRTELVLHKELTMEVETPGRIYFLRSDSRPELMKWGYGLQKISGLHTDIKWPIDYGPPITTIPLPVVYARKAAGTLPPELLTANIPDSPQTSTSHATAAHNDAIHRQYLHQQLQLSSLALLQSKTTAAATNSTNNTINNVTNGGNISPTNSTDSTNSTIPLSPIRLPDSSSESLTQTTNHPTTVPSTPVRPSSSSSQSTTQFSLGRSPTASYGPNMANRLTHAQNTPNTKSYSNSTNGNTTPSLNRFQPGNSSSNLTAPNNNNNNPSSTASDDRSTAAIAADDRSTTKANSSTTATALPKTHTRELVIEGEEDEGEDHDHRDGKYDRSSKLNTSIGSTVSVSSSLNRSALPGVDDLLGTKNSNLNHDKSYVSESKGSVSSSLNSSYIYNNKTNLSLTLPSDKKQSLVEEALTKAANTLSQSHVPSSVSSSSIPSNGKVSVTNTKNSFTDTSDSKQDEGRNSVPTSRNNSRPASSQSVASTTINNGNRSSNPSRDPPPRKSSVLDDSDDEEVDYAALARKAPSSRVSSAGTGGVPVIPSSHSVPYSKYPNMQEQKQGDNDEDNEEFRVPSLSSSFVNTSGGTSSGNPRNGFVRPKTAHGRKEETVGSAVPSSFASEAAYPSSKTKSSNATPNEEGSIEPSSWMHEKLDSGFRQTMSSASSSSAASQSSTNHRLSVLQPAATNGNNANHYQKPTNSSLEWDDWDNNDESSESKSSHRESTNWNQAGGMVSSSTTVNVARNHGNPSNPSGKINTNQSHARPLTEQERAKAQIGNAGVRTDDDFVNSNWDDDD